MAFANVFRSLIISQINIQFVHQKKLRLQNGARIANRCMAGDDVCCIITKNYEPDNINLQPSHILIARRAKKYQVS